MGAHNFGRVLENLIRQHGHGHTPPLGFVEKDGYKKVTDLRRIVP
jgi:hypothetical protein